MQQLGSDALNTCDMHSADIWRERNDFLVMTAQDYLFGKELGAQELRAMGENAHNVESECLTLIADLEADPIDDHQYLNTDLYKCLVNLAGMIKSVSAGAEVDETGKMAIYEHIEVITEMLDEEDRANNCLIEDCLGLQLLELIAMI